MTKEITKQIDTKVNDLRTELKSEINTKIDHSETYFRNECLLLNNTIETLTARMEKQALEINQLKASVTPKTTDPLSNPDITVIVSGLPVYPQEDPLIVAQNVVDNLGADYQNVPVRNQVKVIKAARLPNRHATRPPLLKISFRSLAEKKVVLTHKRNLQKSPYNNLYIRSSKSHEERLIELNTKTILENSPWGKDFRVTASGHIVSKVKDPHERTQPDNPERQFTPALQNIRPCELAIGNQNFKPLGQGFPSTAPSSSKTHAIVPWHCI